ncbi:D-2-hydroxyacid dehydrogenase [Chloroflexota bacterium]
MDKVNVLVLTRAHLPQEYLDHIVAADPRISVTDGTEQFLAELREAGKEGLLEDTFETRSNIAHGSHSHETQDDLDALLARADVIFGVMLRGLPFPENLLSRSPNLNWIHIGAAGVERYLASGIFDGNAVITNSRGVMAIPIAEHALAFIFMLAKNAPRLLENKRNRLWDPFATMELRNRTVGIIGLGAIGSEVGRLAKGIGMKVIATRRSAKVRESGVFGVDELYPPGDLLTILSESDYIVITVPLTEETRGMIGEAELRMMKPAAFLINIARGPIVDQPAIIKALKEGWIAGAGLDVFETDPLPPDSELWELPNAILSYHMAALADTHSKRSVGIFCENLRNYLAGEALINIVDKHQKY